MSDDKAASASHEEEEEEDEEDLDKLQAEIARMEEEAARIAKETEELEKKKAKAEGKSDEKPGSEKSQMQRDGNSIYVGQVDYSSTPEELLSHFEACGTVERVTIVWYVRDSNIC
jgi:polyadenylate-binding protein 2